MTAGTRDGPPSALVTSSPARRVPLTRDGNLPRVVEGPLWQWGRPGEASTRGGG